MNHCLFEQGEKRDPGYMTVAGDKCGVCVVPLRRFFFKSGRFLVGAVTLTGPWFLWFREEYVPPCVA